MKLVRNMTWIGAANLVILTLLLVLANRKYFPNPLFSFYFTKRRGTPSFLSVFRISACACNYLSSSTTSPEPEPRLAKLS
jgi:hypothetical protein